MKLWPTQGDFCVVTAILLATHKVYAKGPDDDYKVLPPFPTADQSSEKASAATNAASLGASEAFAANAAAFSSESMESAAASHLQAARKQLQSRIAFAKASHAAEQARANRVKADSVAREIMDMKVQLPIVAKEAREEAVKEVIAKAIAKMNVEANHTAEAALAAQKKALEAAAQRAQDEALPFQQSKVRSEQTAVEYAVRARELAKAVIPLKAKAMEVAESAEPFQKSGNVVVAQQMLMKGHDILDKALQLQGTAKSFDSTARTINNDLGLYDEGAAAAAEWGAYQANPSGKVWGDFPPLPNPLKLGPIPGGPAPAAAPAAAFLEA